MTINVNKSGARSIELHLAPMNSNTQITIQKKLGYNKIMQNDELIDILDEGYSLSELISISNDHGTKLIMI